MIVVDASAAIHLLLRAEARADRIRKRLAAEATVNVPAVFDLEVLEALTLQQPAARASRPASDPRAARGPEPRAARGSAQLPVAYVFAPVMSMPT